MPPSVSIADPADAVRAASEPRFLRKLDGLRFTGQRSVSQLPGSTPVARATQASGLELGNHRSYVPGDDLRYLDWNAFGRLDQRVVKLFRAEREAPVHLFIDASASMGVPAEDTKLGFAIALAAALAYVALRQGNPVRAAVLAAEGPVREPSPLIRHVQRIPELHAHLRGITARGPTCLVEGIGGYLRSTRLPGTAIVISDYLVEPPVYQLALETLLGRAYDVVAVRVLGALERDPSALPRRVRLHDVESNRERLIELTTAHRRRYAEALERHLAALRVWCDSRAIRFATADTAAGLDACLLTDLTRAGLLC